MTHPPKSQINILFIALLLCCMLVKLTLSLSLSAVQSSLMGVQVHGHFSFEGNEFAARDFGNHFHFLPWAVLHPKKVSDIASTMRHAWQMGPASGLTVAARGHGHSLMGQAQAPQGVVINMEALGGQEMQVHKGKSPYVDAPAGELWINVLHKCLKHGLAPKSWTDYLHLTVGGTLSNAGISGQAFRHGPQISNVHQLEVITGLYMALPWRPRWARPVWYNNQSKNCPRASTKDGKDSQTKPSFARDQEHLISTDNTFDYIEGLVIKNRSGLINNWRSSFNLQDPEQASHFVSDGRTLFCLELTKNFNPDEEAKIEKEIESLLSELSYIPSTLFVTEVSYLKFLDRVHAAELKLRSVGLWDIPHPWLNLLVPRSKIHSFADGVFGNILTHTNNGPVLIYPVNKSKWDNRTSVVTPDEDVFYLVAFLSHAAPSSAENEGLHHMLNLNKRILSFCDSAELGVKQYLPHYSTQEEWRAHFGPRWETFAQRKSAYDPLTILAPGQRIFQKSISIL